MCVILQFVRLFMFVCVWSDFEPSIENGTAAGGCFSMNIQ